MPAHLTSRQARAAATVLLLLLAVPAAAAEKPLADVETLALSAGDPSELWGSLAALELLGGEHDRGTLSLSAASALATYERDSQTTVASQATHQPDAEPPETQAFKDITAGTAFLGAHHDVYVLPLPGASAPRATAPPGCSALTPSDRDVVRPEAETLASRQHGDQADVRRSAAWTDERCRVDTWTIEGSFLVTLWEADLSFQHDGGHAAYTTGAEYRADPDTSGLTGRRYNEQLYLEVHDGLLRVQASGAAVFLAEAALTADRILLQGVTGAVPAVSGTVDGSNLELRGSLHANVTAVAGRLAVQVSGRLDGSAVDGQAVALSPDTPLPPSTWLAGLLFPVALAGTLAWRSTAATSLARLELFAAAGRHAEVVERGRRLQRVRGLSDEATALVVEGLARTGRVDAALGEAGRLPPAEAALAQAYAYALGGDARACVASLRACGEIDARWVRAALRDPVFAEARRDRGLRAFLEGRA